MAAPQPSPDPRADLTAPRWQVRREALRRLEALGGDDVVHLHLAALTDRARLVRRHAMSRLGRGGAEVVPAVAACLEEPDPRLVACCAAILAVTLPGRDVLFNLPDRGRDLLIAALALDDLLVFLRRAAARALIVCPGQPALDCLIGLLTDDSAQVRDEAARSLWARDHPAAVPWVLGRVQQSWLSYPGNLPELITWLGEREDPRARPVLKRLLSPWRALVVPGEVRAAARVALERIETALAHIPTGALSRAEEAPTTARALSLWREDLPADELLDEDQVD